MTNVTTTLCSWQYQFFYFFYVIAIVSLISTNTQYNNCSKCSCSDECCMTPVHLDKVKDCQKELIPIIYASACLVGLYTIVMFIIGIVALYYEIKNRRRNLVKNESLLKTMNEEGSSLSYQHG